MATKKVKRKAQVDETQIVHSANTTARVTGDVGEGPPKIHAKVVYLCVSVGTEDRDRNIEDFIEEAKGALEPVVKRSTVMSNYYILDGKVCLPADYNPETQNFNPGAVPPPWAGGPSWDQAKREAPRPSASYLDGTISKEEGERRIAKHKARHAAEKASREEEEIESFDWDEGDVEDSESHDEVVDEMASKAAKKLKVKRKR